MARISLKPVFNAKELSHASKIYVFCQVNIWLDFGINLIAFDSFLYAKGLKKIPYIKTHGKKLMAWGSKTEGQTKLSQYKNYFFSRWPLMFEIWQNNACFLMNIIKVSTFQYHFKVSSCQSQESYYCHQNRAAWFSSVKNV